MSKQKIYDKEHSFLTIRPDNEQDFSKYMSYLLRHHPDDIGLRLKEGGWVRTTDFIVGINNSNKNPYVVTLENIIKIVDEDAKQRYSFKASGENKYTYIRANQGHSIKDLIMNFREVDPPKFLYHGTSESGAKAIYESGAIKAMSRQMVHLSKNYETAVSVGKRHGKPVILVVDCEKAKADGVKFYISENGVYLSDKIDTKYIKKYEEHKLVDEFIDKIDKIGISSNELLRTENRPETYLSFCVKDGNNLYNVVLTFYEGKDTVEILVRKRIESEDKTEALRKVNELNSDKPQCTFFIKTVKDKKNNEVYDMVTVREICLSCYNTKNIINSMMNTLELAQRHFEIFS